jgi:glycosyltransferase involved in cell wall biosynthesis
MSEWIDKGHEVHLLTFDGPDNLDAYPIDQRVIRHRLGNYKSSDDLMSFARTNVTRVRSVWRVLRKVRPKAIVSFLLEANVIATLVGRSLGVPVLISERNHPGRHRLPAAKALMRSIVYPRSTRLCVQTEDIRQWFDDRLTCDVVVLPNPVAMDEVGAPRPSFAAEPGGRRKYAVTLALLARQKGLDRLITAFSRIAHQVPGWELIIFGEGDQRQELENQIAKLGLSDRVRLPGATQAPRSELQRADLYVHPARYEGYPNAVLEALEAGLCVVATDCPGATREILQDGKFGILVPDDDIDALIEALAQAMSDEALRMQYAAKARDAILGLEPAAIAQRWLEVIEACRPRAQAEPASLH